MSQSLAWAWIYSQLHGWFKKIGGKCNFNVCKNSTFETHLWVQFIYGLHNSDVKEWLLQEPPTTKVDDIIKIEMTIKTSKSESKEMENYEKSLINKSGVKKSTYNKNTFKRITYKKNTENNTRVEKKIKYYRWEKSDNKAFECKVNNKLFCLNCHKQGHVEAVCFRDQKQLEIEKDFSDYTENE